MKTPLRLIIRKMNKLNILHRIYISKAAAKNGVYFGQPPILEFIEAHDQCTQKEVADFMQVSQPSIATSIKRMQKAGLLKKMMDESDQRYNRISITEKGKKLNEICRKDFDQVDNQLFSGFSEQECEQFFGYIDRMIKNLSVGELANKTFFSLIEEEKKLQVQQIKNSKEESHND